MQTQKWTMIFFLYNDIQRTAFLSHLQFAEMIENEAPVLSIQHWRLLDAII